MTAINITRFVNKKELLSEAIIDYKSSNCISHLINSNFLSKKTLNSLI